MNQVRAQQLMQQVEQDYDAIAEHFASTRMHQWYEVQFLIEQYVQPGQRILDLGCGNGRVAEIVRKIKGQYVGMDVSTQLISIAKRLHPQDEFHIGSMTATGFPDHAFHHVCLIASLQHIPSTELRIETLRETKRIVQPGGHIIMLNWNLHQWRFLTLRLKFNLRKILGTHDMDYNDVLIPWKHANGRVIAERYYHGFTQAEMRQLAKDAGLTIAKQYYETNGMHVSRRTGKNLVTILRADS